MVPDSTSNTVNQNPNIITIISSNHNIQPDIIRRLLQNSLSQLEVDPIPTRIEISDIVISRDSNEELTITCEVSYFVETT